MHCSQNNQGGYVQYWLESNEIRECIIKQKSCLLLQLVLIEVLFFAIEEYIQKMNLWFVHLTIKGIMYIIGVGWANISH